MKALARLRADRKGATLVEFALIAPTFLVMLLGAFEFGHGVYLQALLQGAVQDAGRDSGLESGQENLGLIDARVLAQVRAIAPAGVVASTRKNYKTFKDVGKPEDFTDANGNGVRDADECFIDANGNGGWDVDRSQGGLGGADDVVVYTATLTYDRIVPLWKIIGWSQRNRLVATTTLRNQPFADQAERHETMICP
jgi:Flp pilus assembly protein TadG